MTWLWEFLLFDSSRIFYNNLQQAVSWILFLFSSLSFLCSLFLSSPFPCWKCYKCRPKITLNLIQRFRSFRFPPPFLSEQTLFPWRERDPEMFVVLFFSPVSKKERQQGGKKGLKESERKTWWWCFRIIPFLCSNCMQVLLVIHDERWQEKNVRERERE